MPNSRSILVVGAGGREHALVKACLASPECSRVIAAPGNGGIAADCPCFDVPVDQVDSIVALARRERIDFVIVGPELPLSLGLVDALEAAGIPAYGPTAAGARLEASKVFTKRLLLKHGIPTPAAEIFSEAGPALACLRSRKFPVVIKADGLAAGKGVVVTESLAEAEDAVGAMLSGAAFGESGRHILIEECVFGEETSIHLVVSDRNFVVLPTSQDHKRAGEGDTGPNTGGMGAYSPAEIVTPALLQQITETIARPCVEAIAAEGIRFRGTLYIGLMLTADGPKVLEFNTRFGDPETQVIVPRLADDLVALLWAASQGRLAGGTAATRPEAALCVVIAAQGYPGAYPKGEPIELPAAAGPDAFIFHAGTALAADGRLVANGGRVLGVTCLDADLANAARRAYALCEKINFDSKYFRRDIGARQLNRSGSGS